MRWAQIQVVERLAWPRSCCTERNWENGVGGRQTIGNSRCLESLF